MKKWYPTFREYLENEYNGPWSSTDLIIRHNDGTKEGIVLIERKNEPYGIALPGGIAEHMQFWENAIKEGKEETGLEIILDDKDRPLIVMNVQDPRGVYIGCHVYTGEGRGILKPHEDEDAKSASVYTLDEVRNLLMKRNLWAFEHHINFLEIYLKSLK